MLFALSNLKRRSYRDDEGELSVVPKLLVGRNAHALVEQAMGVFEGFVGKTRGEYDPRALEAVMSDYRVARCLEACLLTYYAFVQPQLGDVLTGEQLASLTERGIITPSAARLALWDTANTRYGGFVPPLERDKLMALLADEWGLSDDPELVDIIIQLDSEAQAVLTQTRDRPTARELMTMYNRGAVKTLLAHSTNVVFDVSSLPGSALKRLYFVAKKRGVLVEIEQRAGRDGYLLTLFGPEQAFGSADKYGLRLADVALSLLRSLVAEGSAVEATAHLSMHEREYRFHLTPEMLERLRFAPEAAPGGKGRIAETPAAYSVGTQVEIEDDGAELPGFDSMVEAALYREHKSLEKQGYTHGWRLEREPDPLLAPGIVLIPDFAFLRGGTRVFMEIAGFWTPAYREKKLGKLRALAALEEESALIVAVPHDAASFFSGLPFPVVPYKNSLRMTDLLAVLDARYGQREERAGAAHSRVAALREEALERGLVPEGEVAEALQAYTRTELLETARALSGEGCTYVAGVGLLSDEALAAAHSSLQSAMSGAVDGKLDLSEAARVAAEALGREVDVEVLVQMWGEWRVERPSLFEGYLVG